MTLKRATSRVRQNRVITEQSLLGHTIARDAFDKLTRRGVDGVKLLQLLRLIPYAPDKAQAVVGMSARSLRALPDKIRNLADAIERVNASPSVSPTYLPPRMARRNPAHLPYPLNLTLHPGLAELSASKFHKLPATLRLYADHLRAWLKTFSPGKWGHKGVRLKTMFTLELLQLVRDSAGRPFYPEVATLLEAAYEAAGNAKTIGEGDLIQLEKNNLWLAGILHYIHARPELLAHPSPPRANRPK